MARSSSQSRQLHKSDIETLEIRRMLSSDIRSLDGTGNNLSHPQWGSINIDLLRKAAAAYEDGIAAPAGSSRPSARTISEAVSAADPEGTRNARSMSAWVYVWGQFIDHDLDLTVAATPAEAFNVRVPATDALFDPAGTAQKTIALNRSQFDPNTGETNPRQQTNSITAWLDASMVYGADASRAAALRSFSGGKLKTSAGDMLPFNSKGLNNANDAHILPDSSLYLAGDVRVNENVDLVAVQTLFMREHNRLADQISRSNRNLSDEQIYQRARAMVIGEIQAITYNEFLPALLGQGAIGTYRGYNANVNPGIATEFSTAGFRLGHSLLGDDIEFLDNDGEELREALELRDAFFNPGPVQRTGIGPVLKYLASDAAQEIDPKVVDDVRNFLFGPPGAGGFDLASLNIQRGRDHGLSDYNTTRAAYGLPRVSSFSQITSDRVLAGKLRQLYSSVNNVDLWVGGLAEDHARGSSVGPLIKAIVSDQFARIRDGDRFWYQREFAGTDELATLQSTTLADVVSRNSEINNLQDNIFFFNAGIGGTLFSDANHNGRLDRREQPLRGWKINLVDDEGAVVDTAATSRSGAYSFSELDLGEYHVAIVPHAGWRATQSVTDVALTRGITISNVNYGFTRATGSSRNTTSSATGSRGHTSHSHSSDDRDVLDRLT